MASDAAMVTALKTALESGTGGVVRVTIAEVTTEWDRAHALVELEFYERRAARAAGRRPIAASIKLGNL